MNKKFLEQNITDLIGLDSLSPEKRAELLESASQVIFQAIVLRLADVLNEEDVAQLGELFEKSGRDDEELLNFLKERVPNIDEIINEEIISFKKEAVDLLS